MPLKRIAQSLCWLMLFAFFALPSVFAQDAGFEEEKKEKPNQLDIIKVDLLQIGVNELRFWYESELTKTSSIELGAGYIFRNAFWYERGERPMLANGMGVYLGLRKYMDKKKYFSEPFLRSYVSPLLFYRYSQVKDEWLAYDSGTPGVYDCALISEKIQQLGIVLRFGWQTTQGRLALDFYTGLGFKYIPSTLTTHVITPLTGSCVVNNTTYASGASEKFNGTNVIFNGGIKLGLRRNNRERNYDEVQLDQDADPAAPPAF